MATQQRATRQVPRCGRCYERHAGVLCADLEELVGAEMEDQFVEMAEEAPDWPGPDHDDEPVATDEA